MNVDVCTSNDTDNAMLFIIYGPMSVFIHQAKSHLTSIHWDVIFKDPKYMNMNVIVSSH